MMRQMFYGLGVFVLSAGTAFAGGFGGPTMGFGQIGESEATVAGGQGGAVFPSGVYFGGAGFGIDGQIETKVAGELKKRKVSIGYGGILLGYMGSMHSVFNPFVDLLIGRGSMALELGEQEDDVSTSLTMLVPTVGLDIATTPWLHLAIGVSYRYAAGDFESLGMKASQVRGADAMIHLRFGAFENKTSS